MWRFSRKIERLIICKNYFYSKQKLYIYKVEVTVRPNGYTSAFSAHLPGLFPCISIFQRRRDEQKEARTDKVNEDKEMDD